MQQPDKVMCGEHINDSQPVSWPLPKNETADHCSRWVWAPQQRSIKSRARKPNTADFHWCYTLCGHKPPFADNNNSVQEVTSGAGFLLGMSRSVSSPIQSVFVSGKTGSFVVTYFSSDMKQNHVPAASASLIPLQWLVSKLPKKDCHSILATWFDTGGGRRVWQSLRRNKTERSI